MGSFLQLVIGLSLILSDWMRAGPGQTVSQLGELGSVAGRAMEPTEENISPWLAINSGVISE